MQSLWDFLYSGVYDFVTDALCPDQDGHQGLVSRELFVARNGYKAFKEVVGGIGIGSIIVLLLVPDLRPALAACVLRPAGRGET